MRLSHFSRFLLCVCLVFGLYSPHFISNTSSQNSDLPNLVIYNAKIITMEPNEPIYEYVEIKNGLITSLREDTVQDYLANSDVRTIDLGGRTLLPGFIDSHSHWIGDKGNQGNNPDESIALALSGGWTSISELFVNEDRLNELIFACGVYVLYQSPNRCSL